MIADPGMSRDGDGRDTNPNDEGDWCAPQGRGSSWHGTHVAGIAAAATDNGEGVAGVAPEAGIVNARGAVCTALGRSAQDCGSDSCDNPRDGQSDKPGNGDNDADKPGNGSNRDDEREPVNKPKPAPKPAPGDNEDKAPSKSYGPKLDYLMDSSGTNNRN